ncbi:hypothetical protein GGH94_003789 [Coemansia aciculifera]|uniref:Uncharacterized protein n=1 Tax=Coemansia aciculifera TaxID=417176 RepID=A0A9W8M5F5_9FUNG|nr:hypothetical protein GGH94_003789 [Coemansia aciculifera]KAJ2872886.1 hypothetical protein GGH93_003665 [Coemansia aciculifera]
MSSPSMLQKLPLHVVQILVGFVVDSCRSEWGDINTYAKEYVVLLRPLLWVCRNTRAVALSLYCSYYNLDIVDMVFNMGGETEHLLPYPRTLGYPTHELAKTMYILVDDESICAGHALQSLSLLPYGGYTFPKVRTVDIYMLVGGLDVDSRTDSAVAEANISAFIQWIRNAVPLVNKIRVRPRFSDTEVVATGSYYGSLISQLFQLADRVKYGHSQQNNVQVELQLDNINNLVHITYDFDGDIGQFIQLARQNSQTLECLVLEYGADADLCRLIRDVGGGLVTFPHLQILKMNGISGLPPSPRPIFPGAVPFPSLQIISNNAYYAFGDDTLFRGNAATLRDLELTVDRFTVAMIRRYRVFAPDSHPKLQCVAIRVLGDGNHSDVFATAAEYIRFTLDISPRVATLVFETGFSCGEFLSQLTLRENYAYIQNLTIQFTQLTFVDVITLIKSLPLLSVLCARYPVIGPIPNDVAIVNLPAFVCAEYAPIGMRFRYWRLSYYMGLAEEFEAAVCVLMLAFVCPNFDFVIPTSLVVKSFKAQLEQVIGVWRVEEHEPRLRRLVTHLPQVF